MPKKNQEDIARLTARHTARRTINTFVRPCKPNYIKKYYDLFLHDFEDLQDVGASAAGRKFEITVLPIATCCHLRMNHNGVGLDWHANRRRDKLDEGTALSCVHAHELLTQPSNLHSTSRQKPRSLPSGGKR